MIYKTIGLMSGTSLDGLDIAHCEFLLENNSWKYNITHSTTIEYTANFKEFLKNLPLLSGLDLLKAHNQFGYFCGGEIKKFIQQFQLNPSVIGSHGHTVFHNPTNNYTLQIGNGANIYAVCDIPVVCDFRSIDVALGGQGAPLVPIGDKLLFSNYPMCLNLGGIANVSLQYQNQRIAFDVCPVNIVLNHYSKKINSNFEYDKGGAIARSGRTNYVLLEELNQLSYYKSNFPKSLGKEWIDSKIFPLLESYKESEIPDILNTFCHHIAMQIALVANEMLFSKNEILATGGGALNEFLIELINHYLENNIECVIPDQKVLNFKEAMIFAFLAVLKLKNEVNCLSSVTGSTRDHVGGALYGPSPFKYNN